MSVKNIKFRTSIFSAILISESPYRAIICTSSSVEGFSVVIVTRVFVTLEEIRYTSSTITGKNDDSLDEETRSERSVD
jgi:hypothetical protein